MHEGDVLHPRKSGGGVRDSPWTALHKPIGGLVLYFLGISSYGRRWNCAPRFVFVGAILAVPRRGGQSGLTRRVGKFRTHVSPPMPRLSTVVAIALYSWAFGSEVWD